MLALCIMWINNFLELNPKPHHSLIPWLQVPDNLGNALRKICDQLTVKIISEQRENFLADELSILNDSSGYVRTILLQGDDQPFCYCRTAVSQQVYEKYAEEFRTLGMKLIGETMLYNNSKTTRSSFAFCKINLKHELYDLINQAAPHQSKAIYARRSIFLMNGIDIILITEIFLNDFYNKIISI